MANRFQLDRLVVDGYQAGVVASSVREALLKPDLHMGAGS